MRNLKVNSKIFHFNSNFLLIICASFCIEVFASVINCTESLKYQPCQYNESFIVEFNTSQQNHNEIYILNDIVSGRSMQYLTEGFFIPPEFQYNDTWHQQFFHAYGCVYTINGTSLSFSRRWRGRGAGWWIGDDEPIGLQAKISSHIPYLHVSKSTKILFGGFMHGHHGHFLVELLPRLWPLLYDSYDIVVVYCIYSSDKCQHIESLETAIELITLNKFQKPKLMVIHSAFKFHCNVYIPESAWFDELLDFHPVAKQVFDKMRISVNKTLSLNKCYILRDSGLKREAENFSQNENELVNFMNKSYGFISFEPGFVSFRSQIERFASCISIVGRVGTALHNIMFAYPNATTVVIEDNRLTQHTQYKLFKLMEVTNYIIIPFHGNWPVFDIPHYKYQISKIFNSSKIL